METSWDVVENLVEAVLPVWFLLSFVWMIGKSTLTDSLVAAASVIGQEVDGDASMTNFVTLERGRSKQEEFMKKVQEMMVEQEKQRIPIAQPLLLTTDEPEYLVKPPVKESTRPVDLVLHSVYKKCEACTYIFERRSHMF
ncbi:WVD2-like protein 4 [Tanacetum coccineum]